MGMRKFFLVILLIMVFAFVHDVYAKRRESPEPAPIIYKGVEYTAPKTKMGYVVAYESATGKRLWEKKVYDVFIFFGGEN